MEIKIHNLFLTLLTWFQGNVFFLLPSERDEHREGKMNLLKVHTLVQESSVKDWDSSFIFLL